MCVVLRRGNAVVPRFLNEGHEWLYAKFFHWSHDIIFFRYIFKSVETRVAREVSNFPIKEFLEKNFKIFF